MSYSKDFKRYFNDLGKKTASPAGGSALVVSLCMGIGLIEKAINYSSGKNFLADRYLNILKNIKNKVHPYIDIDGEIFQKILKTKGKRKRYFIKRSENILIEVGRSCWQINVLTEKIKANIKKYILSDFNIGRDFLKTVLKGCILSLETNFIMFGIKSRFIKIFKGYLKKWG